MYLFVCITEIWIIFAPVLRYKYTNKFQNNQYPKRGKTKKHHEKVFNI